MILANGCPRTGTHLVLKFLGMLGLQDSSQVLVKLRPQEAMRGRRLLSETEKKPFSMSRMAVLDHHYMAHAHVCYGGVEDMRELAVRNIRTITTHRDPRAAAVSTVRWHRYRGKLREEHKKLSDEELLLDILKHGYYAARGTSWVEFARSFWRWTEVGMPQNLNLRFEDLGTPKAAAEIMLFVGHNGSAVEYAEHWLGNGKMFDGRAMHVSMSSQSPEPYDWRDSWTDKVEALWRICGGRQLLKDMRFPEQV